MGLSVAVAALGLAVVLLLFASARGLGRRRARRVPLAHVRDGETIELFAVVRHASSSLRSPIRGAQCCGYTVAVRRQADAGWTIVHERSRAESLLLDDSTGRAVVRGGSICIGGVRTERFTAGRAGLPHEVEQFAVAEGLSIEPGMVVSEAIVLEGDEVSVSGRVHREADVGVGHYRAAADGWVIGDSDSVPLSITVIAVGSAARLPAGA